MLCTGVPDCFFTRYFPSKYLYVSLFFPRSCYMTNPSHVSPRMKQRGSEIIFWWKYTLQFVRQRSFDRRNICLILRVYFGFWRKNGSELGLVAALCEHGNEPSGFCVYLSLLLASQEGVCCMKLVLKQTWQDDWQLWRIKKKTILGKCLLGNEGIAWSLIWKLNKDSWNVMM